MPRDESEGVRKVDGKPRDELGHEDEARAYRIVFRRSPGGPGRIHPVSTGEPEKS